MHQARKTAGGHRRFTVGAGREFAREYRIELSSEAGKLFFVNDNRQFNSFLAAAFATNVSSQALSLG